MVSGRNVVDFDKLEVDLGYQFSDRKLLIQAVTHCSYSQSHNQRLEFLGDAVLELVVTHVIYKKFPQWDEGQLTRVRAYLVNGEQLAQRAEQLGLQNYIQKGPGELTVPPAMLADAFEALLAAIFIDSGLESCYGCVERWYKNQWQTVPEGLQLKDPKSRLQEFCQAQGFVLPNYKISFHGPDHHLEFTAKCTVEGQNYQAVGYGKSRRGAEQDCADNFLRHLGLSDD